MAKLVIKAKGMEEVLYSKAVVRVVFMHRDSQNEYYIYLAGGDYYVLPSGLVDFNELVRWANDETDIEIQLD